MSVEYCTIDDVRLYAFQYDEQNDSGVFRVLIPRASAIFDTLCGVSPGYFLGRKETDPATEKVFFGTGGLYLTLPPYVGELEISMPSGYSVPKYTLMDNALFITDSQGILITPGVGADGYFWPKGVAVTIKAKWGYEKTPDDVVEAVVELVVAMWRSKDSAFLRQINLENHMTVNSAVPPRTRMIVQQYKTAPWGAAFV